MALNTNEDTEFNDALRKHGILPRREPISPSPSPPPAPRPENILPGATLSELTELDDENFDSDTERMIAAYRQQRLAELRHSDKTSRFGDLYPISREDYTKEVTEASKEVIPGEPEIKGTGVVCFLYKDGQVASTRLAAQLKTLAERHPRTKFVSIIGDKCIPNYGDKLCPTLIVYRGGSVTRQEVAWGGDKERTLAELEAMLILSLAITTPGPGEPRKASREDESEEDEDEDEGRLSSILRSKKHGTSQPKSHQNLRSSTHDDDGSDFDL